MLTLSKYTRREMAMRVALLYTGQTLAYCTAGLIAAAVFGTLDQVCTSAIEYEDVDDALTTICRATALPAGSGSSLSYRSAEAVSPLSHSSFFRIILTGLSPFCEN